MSSGARSGVVIVAVLLITVGGFVAGTQLGGRASEPGSQTLTLDRPSATEPRDVGLRSLGGFTGFEEGALSGAVTRTGVAESGEDGGNGPDGTFTVHTETAQMQVRTSSPARLYRIATAESPLAPGDVVVVRVDGDGVAEAVLRVPADLREGDSR